jgi:hypothetical protein
VGRPFLSLTGYAATQLNDPNPRNRRQKRNMPFAAVLFSNTPQILGCTPSADIR